MVRLILQPMTRSQYQTYISEETGRYARENVRAGYWPRKDAIKLSNQAHEKLLPKGLSTKDHFFFVISDQEGRTIGYIWFAIDSRKHLKEAFIYDFFIIRKYRGKGMGTAALEETGREARRLGARKLSLHVFHHNEVARALYGKVGFSIDSLNMSKKL